MKTCCQCILPETFPGVRFDEEGVCNHCRHDSVLLPKNNEKKASYRKRLDDMLSEARGRAPVYDVVMAYSGGKDSSYTLKILREQYDLRVLAYTFDNHFIAPMARKNIAAVTGTLGADLMTFAAPWPAMKALFTVTASHDVFAPATLMRASSICTACIGIVKSLVLKTALEMSIPFVAFGWSPGQAPIQSAIMKTNGALMRQNQRALTSNLSEGLKTTITPYLIPDIYYEQYADRFPYNIHPLAFFDYDEAKIGDELKDIGWEAPTNTDTNSTNCLLNAFANHVHLERHRFHPYVWEIANMVRQGVMSREEGMKKIYSPQNDDMVRYGKEKLGL